MYTKFDLTGKVALVVGGAGDLGSALAIGLAQAGADIAVADLKLDTYPEIEKKIKGESKKCMSVAVDVTSEKSVADMVAAVIKKYEKIDILVCAQGIAIRKPADTFPVEEWQKVMDVNARGVFICCQAVGRVMLKQGSGRIINLSSVRGEYGLPANYIAYSPSKAAVNLITKDLACEWAKKGITVNAIAPTVIESALTKAALADPNWEKAMKARIPMGRFGVTDDLVGPVIFFASKASDFVTGQILYIDGGVTTC
jgi:NAD(P)-dependent dehydrogenase (short-subunit alcohol dehydrogenase family)